MVSDSVQYFIKSGQYLKMEKFCMKSLHEICWLSLKQPEDLATLGELSGMLAWVGVTPSHCSHCVDICACTWAVSPWIQVWPLTLNFLSLRFFAFFKAISASSPNCLIAKASTSPAASNIHLFCLLFVLSFFFFLNHASLVGS